MSPPHFFLHDGCFGLGPTTSINKSVSFGLGISNFFFFFSFFPFPFLYSIINRDLLEGTEFGKTLEFLRKNKPGMFTLLLQATKSGNTNISDILIMADGEYPRGMDPRLEPPRKSDNA